MMTLGNGTDLIAFSAEKFGNESTPTTSLMKEYAHGRRVFFFEQPVLTTGGDSTYYIEEVQSHLFVVTPYLSAESSIFEQKKALLELLKDVIADEHITQYSMWTDTPAAMPFIRHLSPHVIVYEQIKDYSKTHPELEKELLQYADAIQTNGQKEPAISGPARMTKAVKFRDTVYSL